MSGVILSVHEVLATAVCGFQTMTADGGSLLNWHNLAPPVITLLIFLLRTFNLTLATIRMLSVVRGNRLLAWCIAFVQSFLFITVIQGVLDNINSVYNVLAYAGGYATGIFAGMMLEGRVSPGHTALRIISPFRGETIIDNLHQAGFGATIISGRGRDGTVSTVLCFIRRSELKQAEMVILQSDPEAFITVENVRQLLGGWRT